jgi:hypothetical protein
MHWCAALKANIVWNIIKIISLSWINRTIILLSILKRKYWNNKTLSDAKNKIKLHIHMTYIYYIYTRYILYIYVYKTNQAQAYNKKNLEGDYLIKT